jgi:hypothetical protein
MENAEVAAGGTGQRSTAKSASAGQRVIKRLSECRVTRPFSTANKRLLVITTPALADFACQCHPP